MSVGSLTTCASAVDLFWLPLGAGGRLPVVRWSGRLYESIAAGRDRRRPCPLYHAALELTVDHVRYVVEMAPEWSGRGERGVVVHGPVGARWLGRSRLFRYEVRRWCDGVIPDLRYAVGGRRRLTADTAIAARAFELLDHLPVLTWGRDERGLGDMWNSNSIIAWLLTEAGIATVGVKPPDGGRAPGWAAGVAAANLRW